MPEDESILTRPAPEPHLVVRYGTHTDQVADVWRGEQDRPLVLLIHGGFWRPRYDRGHVRHMAAALSDEGWPVASIEYRREPGHPDLTTEDVRVALATVPKELGRGDGPTVVIGHSAGGHLALWSAAVAPAPGLLGTIALAPTADLWETHRRNLGNGAVTAFLGGTPDDRADLDPACLPTPAHPVVIIYGADDEGVTTDLNQSYAAAHPATKSITLAGSAHFSLIDPTHPAWSDVTAELAIVVKG